MYTIKFAELRDSMTMIPIMALKAEVPKGSMYAGHPFLRRSGFGVETILLTRLDVGHSQIDPYGWPSSTRTMRYAHQALVEGFDSFVDGSVLDVGYIFGHQNFIKVPEIPGAKMTSLLFHENLRYKFKQDVEPPHLIKRGDGSNYGLKNHYSMTTVWTPSTPELAAIQRELGFDPEGYGDPMDVTVVEEEAGKTKVTWTSLASCD